MMSLLPQAPYVVGKYSLRKIYKLLQLKPYHRIFEERRSQVEEKRKSIVLPELADRLDFTYYMDAHVKNPIYLEVKGDLTSRLIALEESFAKEVSRVWQDALALDSKAMVLPIDPQFDENLVRCAIYLAGALYYHKPERLPVSRLEVDLLLKLTSFSFQLMMDDLHQWVRKQLIPDGKWSMPDLLKLFQSDLHEKELTFSHCLKKIKKKHLWILFLAMMMMIPYP
jgi:hypothetical protein